MHTPKEIWNQLLASYSTDKTLIEHLWAEVQNQYTGPGRHYHDLSHIAYMLKQVETHHELIQSPQIMQFSIFYHDIIYKAKRKDNEEKSADLATERLTSLGLDIDAIQRCQQQIMATKAHETSGDADTRLLIDIDLGVLGESPESYLAYRQNIRKEYSMYPNFLYRKGRKGVLQHFLNMEQIFKTSAYHASHEEQARVNLRSELEQL